MFLLLAGLLGLADPAQGSPPPVARGIGHQADALSGAETPVASPGMVFEENQGQTDPAVQFIGRAREYVAFLTPRRTVLVLPTSPGGRKGAGNAASGWTGSVVAMELVGGNRLAPVGPVDRLPGVVNYYLGNDPGRWRTGIPTYARVQYRDVYPGIDVVYRDEGGRLAHDFVVAPGADASVIRLSFEGAESIALDRSGNLVLGTAAGELRLARPVSYQEIAGRRVLVESRYTVASIAGRVARLHVGAYDQSAPLIIDPSYHVTFAGCCHDSGSAVVVDGAGNAYIAGTTASPDFPSTTAQTFRGEEEAFVTGFGPDGTRLFSTILGGTRGDVANGLVVAGAGLVVVGATASRDFPGAAPAERGQSLDAFVAHLDLSGRLLGARYLGGSGDDMANAVVRCGGHLCVVGTTTSPDFPGARAEDRGGDTDAFVTRLDLAGHVIASRYLGGSGSETGDTIAASAVDERIYVVGSTSSEDLPGADPSTRGGGVDAFLIELGAALEVKRSRYLGGSGTDVAAGVVSAADGCCENHIFIVGSTDSGDFPGAIAGTRGGGTDAFVARLSAGSPSMVVSRYLGGSGDDHGQSIAILPRHRLWVVGSTASADFPTRDPGGSDFDRVYRAELAGASDAFLTVLTGLGLDLQLSTYVGSEADEVGRGVAVDPSGAAYVVGTTVGEPTGVFIARIAAPAPQLTGLHPASASALGAVGRALKITGRGLTVAERVSFGDTWLCSASSPVSPCERSDTAISAPAPVRPVGHAATIPVRIEDESGRLTGRLPFRVLSMAPSGAPAGGTDDVVLTISAGATPEPDLPAAFDSRSVVKWNGATLPTTVSPDGSSVTARIGSERLAGPGEAQVVVTMVLQRGAPLVDSEPMIFGIGFTRGPRDASTTVGCSGVPITPGTTVNGELTDADCPSLGIPDARADFYTFSGTAGQQVTITMSAAASFEDTYLFLYDPGGAVVAQNDDCPSSGGLDSCIAGFTLPASGTYTIEATSFVAAGRGAYSLLLILGGSALTVTPASADFGSVSVGTGADRTFTLTNAGSAAIAGTATAAAPFSVTTGATYNLAPGASQAVTVRFTPTASGPASGTVTFSVSGAAPVTRPVSGTGGTCPTTPIAIGATVNGTLTDSDCSSVSRPGSKADRYTFSGTAGQVVTITMNATASFDDTFLALFGPGGSVVVQNDDCPSGGVSSCIVGFTLTASGTYTIEATSFSETARGAYVLVLSAGGSPLSVTPASADFGSVTVGTGADRTFTLTNAGSGTITGTATTAAPFSVTTGASYRLAPGASQAVTVRFNPTVPGPAADAVSFSVSGAAPVTRPVSGIGGTCPTTPIALGATVSGSLTDSDCSATSRSGSKADRYTFSGTAGQVVTITMSAPASFEDTFLALIGPAGTVVASNDDCPSPPGLDSCITGFTLTTSGTYTIEATSFSSSARGAYTLVLAPSGGPVLTVAPASLAFGAVPVGGAVDQTFTLTNGGTGALTGGATTGGAFSIVSGGSYSLAAGASQTVTVRFSPTAVGAASGTVSFNASVGSPVIRPVSGTGATCSAAPIAIGATVSGTLADSDCASITRPGSKADRYTFGGAAGQAVTIVMSAPTSFEDTFLALIGPGGNVVAQSDDCGPDLSSCIADFTLPVTGTYTIEATAFSSSARGAYTLQLTASVGAVLTVDPGAQSFGPVPLGASADRSFTVTNEGAGVLTGAATVAPPFSVVDGLSYSLGPGASQDVTVRFSPIVVGAVSGTVSFSAGPGAPVTRSVSGAGLACALTPITLETPVSGSLTDSDCPSINRPGSNADRYTFSGLAGQRVTITMDAPPPSFVDTVLFLAAPGGDVIAENDDCGDLSSCITGVTLPVTGTYTIEATSYEDTARGAYSLLLTFPGALTLIVTPASQDFGAVTVGGAADRSFTVSNGGTGPITGTATATLPYSVISGGSYNLAPGDSQTIEVRFSPGVTGAAPGSVSFGVTGGPPVTRLLSGTGVTCDSAPITPGTPVSGELADADCTALRVPGARADRYTFSGRAGERVTITMSAPSPSFEDTSLFLRAPGGSLVAENDDCRSSRGFDSCIENFTLPATGTYTIEATSFSAEARGPYTLLAEKTSAADRPPTVTRVAAFGLTSTSAIITWLTDEPATGLVEFGVSCCAQRSTSETVLTLVHAIALDGLSPSTTYFFRVTSADAGGNPTVSEVFRFQTPADTVGPVISRIAVAGVTTGSAVVTWTTGEPATGEVEFGPAGLCPCPFRSPRASALSLDHSLALSGLTPNTRYFFRVLSADAAGNLTVTQGGSFTTADLKLTVGEVAGSVESRDSFGRLLSVSRGFSLPAGALIQTKSESEAKDVTTPDGARFVLSSETGATIGPPAGAPGGEFAAALVRGSVRFTSPAGLGGAAPTVGPQLAAAETPGTQRVRTPTVTVRARDAACAGTAAFTQTGMTGTTVIDVASGTCDVIDRLGRVTTLVAGTQRSFADVVPRVSLVLPADHGNVRRTESGAVPFKNALVWTAFPGAAGYLIEYAVAPAEAFTTANARAVERPANTVQVMSGPGGVTIRLPGMSAPIPVGAETNSFVSYSESAGLVQLDLMLGTPSGTQALWRIFPLDASGAVLAGTEGSDAFLAFVE